MPASDVGVVVRALIPVLPSDVAGWSGLVVGVVLGLAVDVIAWRALFPTSFERTIGHRLRGLRAGPVDQGDDDDGPDDDGAAMWVWCPVCDTYRLDANECCIWCERYDLPGHVA